ncbi:MAG TPA: phospholipase D-like domain-containing protein [Nitrospira sp.]|nr:phospholipase D-like domain-containing protein [Nitrospira sp.]
MKHLTTGMFRRVVRGLSPTGFDLTVCVLLFSSWVAGCASTPTPLTLPSMRIEDPAFRTSLEAFAGAPILGDNRVDILLNGEETFPALLDAIRSAHHTITFEAYIFHEGKVADQIVGAFVERCKAGVRVAILLDAHGSDGLPERYIQNLRDAGCMLVSDFRPLRFWSLERTNKRNHRRIMVIDGRVGFTGGYGVDDTWSGNGRTEGRWRETNVRLQGPIVQSLQEAFVEHWREATSVLLGGKDYFPHPSVTVKDVPVLAQVVRSSPLQGNDAMYRVFLQAISSARTSILISTPYLLPGEQLTEALLDAVRRGVRVRVLVPSVVKSSGVEFVTQASQREAFGALLEGGVQLHEYSPALLHTKMMIIDGTWATVGSTNFDNRSMAMNDELNVMFYDRTIAKRLEEIFAADIAYSHKVSREQLENQEWLHRALGVLLSPFHAWF